jgi:hypothetical protein
MSFSLGNDLGTVKVIVHKDSAIGNGENYDEYLKDFDETKLELSGVPTRFVLKRTLDYRANQVLMRAQMTQKGKDLSFDLSSTMEQVRLHLVDIENPPELPANECIEFKRDSDGFASKQIVSGLVSHGVLMDLYTGSQNANGGPKADDSAKKS